MKIYRSTIGSDDDEITDPATQLRFIADVENTDHATVTNAIRNAGKLLNGSVLQKDDLADEPYYEPWADKYDFYSSWTNGEFDEIVFWVEKH